MNKKCPIQVVEDATISNNRWLTFDKDVHKIDNNPKTLGHFDNIVGFMKDVVDDDSYIVSAIKYLVEGKNKSNIRTSDIIRNPTIKEYLKISNALKQYGKILNLKTYRLINKQL